MKKTVKERLYPYRHAWILSYFALYLVWFFYLEETVRPKIWVHSALDNLIPFCEYFIIPYYLWFLYVAAAIIFFFFASPKEYYRLCGFLFTGMTICLILYMLFPNGHHLRPHFFERDNIFVDMVIGLYGTDTPTNVNPSIHTLNSLAVHTAIWRSPSFQEKPVIRYGSLVLCISIILSTVFLKQHSIEDAFNAFLLAVPLYLIFFRKDVTIPKKSKHRLIVP